MTESRSDNVLQARHLCKSYDEGGDRIDVLRDVSLHVERREMVAIVGASGSGKSTLLHTLGLLDTPTSGTVFINGAETASLSESRRSRLRNRELGRSEEHTSELQSLMRISHAVFCLQKQ